MVADGKRGDSRKYYDPGPVMSWIAAFPCVHEGRHGNDRGQECRHPRESWGPLGQLRGWIITLDSRFRGNDVGGRSGVIQGIEEEREKPTNLMGE